MQTLPIAEAARLLNLTPDALVSLVEGGYIETAEIEDLIPLSEVQAFQARNSNGGAPFRLNLDSGSCDPTALINALDKTVGDLSREALDMFIGQVPEAKTWKAEQRQLFRSQAEGRFGAILAVIREGAEVDEALREDFSQLGSSAAWSGASLPQLLVVMRISRDLLLSSAVKLTAQHQGKWDDQLSAFMARIMAAVDNMVDSLNVGYSNARVDEYKELWFRVEPLLNTTPYGVYTIDLDGVLLFANDAFCTMVNRRGQDLVGTPLADVFPGNVSSLIAETDSRVNQVTINFHDADGEVMTMEVDTVSSGEQQTYSGIVRLVNPMNAADDTAWMARHIHELRRSLEILAEAGAFLTRHSDAMDAAQLGQAGDSVRLQAERLAMIVDELDEERKVMAVAPLARPTSEL